MLPFQCSLKHVGKNIVKGATQVSGHSLKFIFVCLEDHKGSIIVWIIVNVFGIFFINCKFYLFKV